MKIMSGEVTYERKVNLGDYNSKMISWTASFALDEEATVAAFNALSDELIEAVHAKLGLSSAKPAAAPGPMLTATEAGRTKADLEREALAKVSGPAPETKTRGRKAAAPATPLPVQTGPAAADVVAEEEGIPGFLQRGAPEKTNSAGANPMVTTSPEEWEQEAEALAAAPEAQVTDKDLTDACTRKTKAGVGAPAVRELIAKYVAFPKKLLDIPGDKRKLFLQQLEVLK